MFDTLNTTIYTPEQVATLLQLSKNTVYQLINRGEIRAKKIGKVYRIPALSLSFFMTGLDYDLLRKEQIDKDNIDKINTELNAARSQLV